VSQVTPIRKGTVNQLSPKVLAVVAHPDDEYHFSVTLYKIIRELGGVADQVIITDGAGGHRYSSFAEQLYGFALAEPGKALRDVRRAETAVAGRVLGIRQHIFLDQPDTGFTLSQADAFSDWDQDAVSESLDQFLKVGGYDFVFILLPTNDTHGHHKAAAHLTLDAVNRLPVSDRPVVLGAEADAESSARDAGDIYTVSRKQRHPSDASLSYQIIANWVIAAHKSQGLFQMEAGRHDVERFWPLQANDPQAAHLTSQLFRRLQPTAEQVSIPA
jgi:LmbE family N-acetylglucosaminyl deacetylase